jgi:protein-L-isoaspartate(D-aspartate) O-methyltransferase
MAWRCSGATNSALIENMWKNGLITDPLVKEAFLKVTLHCTHGLPQKAWQ